MRRDRWLVVVRLLSASLLLLTATFRLLSSIPWAFYMFIASPPWRWIPVFARVHPLLVCAGVGGLLVAAGPLDERSRPWARRLLLAAVTVAACMALAFWVPAIQSDDLSAAFCFMPLALLAGASVIEIVSRRARLGPVLGAPGGRQAAAVAALAGLATTAAFAINAALFDRAALTLQPRELVVGAAAALAAQVALLAVIAIAIQLTRSAAARMGWAPPATWMALGLVTTAALAVLIRRVVLSALVFDERRTIAVSVALAVTLVAAAIAFLVSRPGGEFQRSPALRTWGRAATGVAFICVLVFVAPSMVRLADWGLTLQKLMVIAVWIAAWATMATVAEHRRRAGLIALGLVAVWGATVAAGVRAGRQRPADAGGEQRDTRLAVERYATFDTSLRVVLDLLQPMQSDGSFLATVRREGDATGDRSLGNVPLTLVDDLHVNASYRPHIFFVVVDSLRPDYLSAYNPAVDFTPAIGAFARESLVMRRAFTAYSGTWLSEPSIWAGGLIPRSVYDRPFAPLNNLERLITAGGYRSYITVDQILGLTLKDAGRSNGVVRLDSHLIHLDRESDAFQVDLCQTLDELTRRLDADRPAQPVFFYTQPQNLHIRVIAGEAPQFDRMRLAPGQLFKPAVAALTRMDHCFGRFIDDLKARRIYDDSIIVLTADHGDAYGEGGQWGHAFFVAPETLRIPLIMHVPARLLAGRRWNSDGVSWLTDVTPTLYELLGATPTSRDAPAGRALLTRADAGPSERSAPSLVQSSYGRAFGLIDRQGQWLFVADANHNSEKFFDLRDPRSTASSPMAEADRLRYRQQLLEQLKQLNSFYRR